MRIDLAFGLLVAAQAVHSVEEYGTRMWELHPGARFVASLVSSDLEWGFAIANCILVGFGLWCIWPVHRQWRIAVPLAWAWVAIEMVNGINHIGWSILAGGYRPGLFTAPFLLASALYLARELRRQRHSA